MQNIHYDPKCTSYLIVIGLQWTQEKQNDTAIRLQVYPQHPATPNGNAAGTKGNGTNL